MGSCAVDVFRVLFCGQEFNWGYKFTKEALQDDAEIEVRLSGWHACIKHCMLLNIMILLLLSAS